MNCQQDNCNNKYYGRNMCSKHYARWYRKTEQGRISYNNSRNKYMNSQKGKDKWDKYYNSPEHKELVNKWARDYYHSEAGKVSRDKYIQSEKGQKYTKEYVRKYRNRKINSEGWHTHEEWLKLLETNPECISIWDCKPTQKLTEDHIIPLSKGGNDWINNIQPLCRPCNAKKGVQTINFLKEMVIHV